MRQSQQVELWMNTAEQGCDNTFHNDSVPVLGDANFSLFDQGLYVA